MPNEYDAARPKPRVRDIGRADAAMAPPPADIAAKVAPVPAWPTMIDETIGSIGSTQGVSDSSTPARKKAPTIDQNVPPRSTDSIAPSSPPAAVEGAGVAASF